MDDGVRPAKGPPPQDPSPSSAATAADGNKGAEPQQQQRHVIRWERFLPRRSLRVLLVEHDDSTRHIVTALLRKCSYHVAAVADGLKAWEVLEEKKYRFDLVLAEVDVPSLSGIGFLSKIMSCESSKNIPVIMMSCHDSVTVVYKCMLKGAVDFLVKPVRRNELRNLWQHVWRKHCSTSYPHGQESVDNNTVKSGNMSGNNAASNHISAVAGSISKNKKRCDEGSDTQSSGSKPEGESQSLAKGRGSNNGEHVNSTIVESRPLKEHDHMDTISVKHSSRDGKKNIVRIRKETAAKEKFEEQAFVSVATETKSANEDAIDTRVPATFDSNMQIRTSNQVIDFLGTVTNGECGYAVLEKDHHVDEFHFETKKSLKVANGSAFGTLLSWELSLRGPYPDGCAEENSQDRHILKHSAASAFSRYCTSVRPTCPKAESSPSTLLVTNTQGDKVESHLSNHVDGGEEVPQSTPSRFSSIQVNEVGATDIRMSPASNHEDEGRLAAGPSDEPHTPTNSNNRDMDFPCQLRRPFAVGGMPFQSLCADSRTHVQQVFCHDASSQHRLHGTDKDESSRSVDLSHHVLPNSMLHHYKEDSRYYPSQRTEDRMNDEELGSRSFLCSDTGRSNFCSELGPRSIVCSDNEQTNRSCICTRNILNCNRSNENGETTDATENPLEIGLQNHDRKGLDRDCSRREAALIKFRLKRKDRCFEKKVRYHSRKKLAEQRPRIKGQFVRQPAVESNAATTEDT